MGQLMIFMTWGIQPSLGLNPAIKSGMRRNNKSESRFRSMKTVRPTTKAKGGIFILPGVRA